jgi:hypothetical protein
METELSNELSNSLSGGQLMASLVMTVLTVVGLWKMFSKAGYPGWAAIVPFYNLYVLVKVAGRSGWWMLLLFIPLVNLIVGIVLAFDLARRFGHGAGYALGLIFLTPLFVLLLGFGGDGYQQAAVA